MTLRASVVSLIWLISLIIYAVFVPSRLSLILLILTMMYLAWLFLTLRYQTKKVHMALQMSSEVDEQPYVEFTNHSKLPVYHMALQYKVTHQYTGEVITDEITLSLKSQAQQRVALPITASWYGMATVQTTHLTYYDAIHLFTQRRSLQETGILFLLPSIANVNKAISATMYQAENEQNIMAHQMTDGTHFNEIKLYQPGDAVKMIHWKVLSKLDDLYVKRWEAEQEERLVMSIDTTTIANDITRYNKLIEHVYGYLHTAINYQKQVDFLLYLQGWEHTLVEHEHQVMLLIKKIMACTKDELMHHSSMLYQQEDAMIIKVSGEQI